MTRQDVERQVMMAARDQGVSSVLFRNAVGRRLGVSVTDNECLSYLTIKGVATPSELAHYTGLTSGSATAMLDRLEEVNFITRKPNPKDRRGTLVEATKKWKESAGSLTVDVQKMQMGLLAEYSTDQLLVIADFLQRFASNTQESARQVRELQ